MYKLINDSNGILNMVYKITENLYIPIHPANTDYQEYLAWLAEGNTPEPADE